MAQQRLGFTRVATSFSHPIHFGLFGTMIFANAYFLFWRGRSLRRLRRTVFVGLRRHAVDLVRGAVLAGAADGDDHSGTGPSPS